MLKNIFVILLSSYALMEIGKLLQYLLFQGCVLHYF